MVCSVGILQANARRVWLVQPARELPLDTRVELRVEPGLTPAVGTERGDENRVVVEFYTFPRFAFLGVRCRERRDEGESDKGTPEHRDCFYYVLDFCHAGIVTSARELPIPKRGHHCERDETET